MATAVVVRHELVVLGAATDPHALVRKCQRSRACSRQRPGPAAGGRAGQGIRDWESASPQRSAQNSRSEVPRPRPDARCERAENSARRRRERYQHPAAAGLRPCGRRSTGRLKSARGRRCAVLRERLAARLIGCESGEMIIGGPARELAPFDRLELAACKFQRPFGRCGGGRETYDRADEACDHAAPRWLAQTSDQSACEKIASQTRDSSRARVNGGSGAATPLWRGSAPIWRANCPDPRRPIAGAAHSSYAFVSNPICVYRNRHQTDRKSNHHDIPDNPHGPTSR